jgi:ATP-dependent DNA helicase RecG
MGLADELGSGMRNTYKYTKLYSGGIPEFCEGDMFKITIPLKQTTEQVSEQVTSQDTEQKSRQISGQMSGQMSGQITHEKSVADIERSILTFCKKPKSRKEIHEYISQFSKSNIIKSYINPLLKKGKLIMTIPDKPHSKNQKYITKSVRKK